ncbi:Gluconate 2-dehydrogenase cytochrome c subunit precursor [Variovorax sp. PBL-H6]|uniref:c-type cytochrome n=1 Tax=Variovorax sp. PBL-H6 TaxID=434009 RepID=UPI001315F77D|nr:cytochrome c [Variovorax sp. PBL-H6]VTU39242.1 Gluconate 2-dehydrogenase cytochrome c subunit precursor [Variovorax sp. PBL-H6]
MTTTARRWLKRGALALLILIGIAAAALFAGDRLARQKMERKVDIAVKALPYREDAAAVERGRYLFASRGCVDCHGAQGSGHTFLDDGKGMRIAGPNISPGPGSVVAGYAPEDWVRSIRHGVSRGGRPLMVMPSEDYNRFTDDDLASLVAYVRQLPPTPGGAAVIDLPLPVRAFYGFGLMHDAAAKIDHTLPPAQPVPDGVSAAHGAYVANMCLGCHGAKLAGGKIPGAPPDWPPAARLAAGEDSAMTRYADAEAFARMFKTGNRPDGTPIKVMPFGSLGQMNDTDVRALFLYLKGLPAG